MWFLNILEGSDHSGDNIMAQMVSIFLFCSDVNGEWDGNDAKVVCRMLGHSTEGAKATNGSKFGKLLMDNFARERYLPMDFVKCNGTEASLADCNHNRGLESMGGQLISCEDGWAAGVICPAGSLCY